MEQRYQGPCWGLHKIWRHWNHFPTPEMGPRFGSPNIHPWSMFYPKARTSLSRSRLSFHEKYSPKISGWWLTYTSEKYEFVSWDDEIPNWMESHSKFHGSKPPTSDIFTNMDPASTSTIYLETCSIGRCIGRWSQSRSAITSRELDMTTVTIRKKNEFFI